MQKVVSKIISFSESETIKNQNSNLPSDALRGVSIIPINKSKKEIISNITFTKLTDESYEKVFEGIQYIDLSSNLDMLNLMQIRAIEGDNINDEDGQRVELRSIPTGHLIHAFHIFLYSLYNFKYSTKSIETIISCEVFFVKDDFLSTILEYFESPVKIDSIELDKENITDISIPENWNKREPDIEISLRTNDKLSLESKNIRYVTTIATSDNSNYNYNIEIDSTYDYILLIPKCSPKSFSVSNPEFIESKNDITNDSYDTIENIIVRYYTGRFNDAERFNDEYKSFLNDFFTYNRFNESNSKLYTLKNVSAVFNCNLISSNEEEE